MSGCLDENAIADFLGGAMEAHELRRCEDHIDRCSTCRVVLAELAHTSAIQERTIVDAEPWAETIPGNQDTPWSRGELLAERFRLLRVAGRGGMGVVHEAEDIVLGVRVAVKMVPEAFAASPTYLRHLHSEIRVGRRIAHRNVCRIYDLGTSGDIHFITMEYVDGETLADLLARGRVPLPRALDILVQVVEALAAAHEVGVIHRDLKPGNIMLDECGQVKVMDFGLAKDLAAESTVHCGPIGTPAYWAPEQSRGEAASAESDIYAFGLIAYEVLAGRYPTEVERQSLAGLRGGARAMVKRCLRWSPRERFTTAAELRVAVDELRANPLRRNGAWRTTVAAVAAASALGLGALVASGFGGTARAAREPVSAQEARASGLGPQEGPRASGLRPRAGAQLPQYPDPEPEARGPRPEAPAVASPPRATVSPRRSRRRPPAPARRSPPPPVPSVAVDTPTAAPQRAQPAEEPPAAARLQVAARLDAVEARRRQRRLSSADIAGYGAALSRARRAASGGEVADASAAIDQLGRLVDGVEVNATFVRAKLERIKRMADDDSLPAATAQRVKQLFERVHRAYFDENYTAANGYLAAIGDLVAQERRR